MSPNDSAGRISKKAYLIIPTVLFAFSVLFVIARTTLRLRLQKRLFVDDAFLFFAEICLCASVGLLYAFSDALFLDEALITRPASTILPPDGLNQLFRFHKLSDAYLVLTYTSIFAVKFSFLFFFRVLVRRVHKMIVYWWIVVAVTTVAWPVSVVSIFLPCLYFDTRSLSCGQNSLLPKTIGFGALASIVDMITDILIIVIPVQLLWNVHIKRRQKMILGTTLCLSIVMILTAIIRISAIRIGKEQTDLVWECFWQIIENCLAITMVCLSAFRAVFVGTNAEPRRNKPRYVHKKNLRNHHNRKNWTNIESEETETLPEIPGATITGMRTLIRGTAGPEESTMRSADGDESNDQSTLHNQGNPSKIWVDYSITHETDESTRVTNDTEQGLYTTHAGNESAPGIIDR